MKVLRQVLDFYINASIHVALAVVAMTWITYLKFSMPVDNDLLLFVFFASITGYNFVKFFGLAKFHHRSLANWLQIIQIFSFICFLLLLFFASQLPFKILLYIAIFGCVTFLYAVPFLPKNLFMDQQKNLRSIGGLKIYVIATVWAGVTLMLPLINADHHIDTDVWLTAFQRFVLIIALMLPFEIRDLRYDSLKLSTIPQKIGIKKTKAIGFLLMLVFFLIEFLKNQMNTDEIIISSIIMIIVSLFLIFARKNQTTFYSSFWVEGVPIMWLLLHVIL